ncbi:5-formyltetrahydrofolate cyclo-ligase [Geoglobus sp.]
MKKDYESLREEKSRIRKLIWDRMLEMKIARFPLPPHGRIPNFAGSEKCGQLLDEIREWRDAEVVKIDPDSPQWSVRLKALSDGKTLMMPTPRIRQGFLVIDPKRVPESRLSGAATIRGAFKWGERVRTARDLIEIGSVDLIVEGSVAVNVHGERLGKGEGYGDLEFAILAELGLVSRDVPVVTTVHEIQIVSNSLPQTPHDVSLDYIITPGSIVRAKNRRSRPGGILSEFLDRRKVREVPILREILHAER